MKNIFLIIILVISTATISVSQQIREKMLQNRGKLEQLEKIKLIETLDMKEDVSVRFFARRNDYKKEIESLEKKADDLIAELQSTFNASDKNIEAKQKQKIADLLSVKESIEQKKKQFINSLFDILTVEQVSKYIVFEKKFREEIKNELIKRRFDKE